MFKQQNGVLRIRITSFFCHDLLLQLECVDKIHTPQPANTKRVIPIEARELAHG
jgi:hypothetical protein